MVKKKEEILSPDSVVEAEIPTTPEKPRKKSKYRFKVLFGFILVNGNNVSKGQEVEVSARDWKKYEHLVEKGIIEEV